ncbi:MAG: RNA-binding domain-containing protein [Candidatus Hydrogenedentales bacterium]|jgi:ATP-dependent DNA helicase RecG
MEKIGLSESLTIEFKRGKDKMRDSVIIDAVVAFSNTNGGDLYLGVEDNGDISGLQADHKDPTRLAAFIANNTVPPVSVRCEIIGSAVPVVKISVPRSACIVASSDGKILRRRLKADGKPENIPMYPHEIQTRLSFLRLLDFSAQAVQGATLQDLDGVERERLRNIIRSYSGEKNLLELDDEELDKALQLTTSAGDAIVPTLTGMLLIGKKDRLKDLVPTAGSAIQVFKGTTIIVNESFMLPLLAAFETISKYMDAWNRSEEMEIGLFRITIRDIHQDAFREALVNAYCHRDYSKMGRVRLQLNDEGLTLSNPGGFVEGINIKNLLEAEPQGRNPVLADALKRIGLAERTGRGIDRIFEWSLRYGRPLPDYSATTDTHVSLFLSKSLPDKNFIEMLADLEKGQKQSFSIYSLLVLNALQQLRRVTVQDLIKYTHITESKIKSILESLTESGVVEAMGTGTGRYYLFSSKVYKDADNTSAYVRQTGIDTLRHAELVLKYAHSEGQVTRVNVVELLHCSSSQAYRILRKLADEKKLKLEGAGKYSRYIPI